MDGREPHQDAAVSHSIFTQKFQSAGDAYGRLLEMPVFGRSENKAGIQLADTVLSAVIAPLAMFVYCTGYVKSYHVSAKYEVLKNRYANRLKNMAFRYPDLNGRMRGGFTVSDRLAQRSASNMLG